MKEFGGLSRVCGVTSDSARACVNARNELSKRYLGLIGTQDQAHVADLLMKDIGKLPFIKDIVDKVNFLVVETRGKRKLLHFVREEIRRDGKRTRAEVASERRNMEADGSTVPSDPLHPQRLFPPLRRTPIMLKKPATTRFASISDTLESFIRCREVLGKVIFDQRFERDLFPAEKPGHKERRDENKSLISSSSFLEGVKEVHNVFRLCRRYLRVFDRETETSIADVVPCTDFLDEALNRVPTSDNVLTMGRMEEIKALFRRRKDGPISGRGIQVRLIEDLHVAACLLHPTKFLVDYQRYTQRLYAFVKRFVKSQLRCDENAEAGAGRRLEEKRVALIDKMMNNYDVIYSKWMQASQGDDEEEDELGGASGLDMRYEIAYRSSPLRFWMEEHRVGECPELCELAMRTLSISPSSCAAERSFSAQGRVRTKLRNRLGDDVVRKMMFVRWNIKHYDAATTFPVYNRKQTKNAPKNFVNLMEVLSDNDELLDSDSDSSSDEDYIDLVDTD